MITDFPFKKKDSPQKASLPDDWLLFEEMLTNLRLAVLAANKTHRELCELACCWYTEGKYRSPVCDSVLMRLASERKSKQILNELVLLYLNLEEGQ